MIKNYLLVTIRNLFKNKLFSLINILGLATGMAGALLVFLYIQYETGYEKFFTNYDNIYRLARVYNVGEGQSTNPSTPYGLATAVLENIPSVESSTKYFARQTTIKYEDKTFKDYVCYTDSLFFKIFDFEFIHGNIENAIKNSDDIIIREKIAKKYFGEENPIGKTLLFDDSKTFKVAGVIKDSPSNTHFDDDIFAPFSDFNDGIPDEEWHDNYLKTYVLLNKNSSPSETELKISELYLQKMGSDVREAKIVLQDLQEQHFDQSQLSEQNIYLFLAIGIFILILACINYMNLNTAKYIKRTKEIGIRKIVGAHRSHLIPQFLGETFLLSFIALFFGILLVETALPYFNQITGMQTDIKYFSSSFLLIVGSIIIFSSLLAGSYPSLFLSSFKPVQILKGNLGKFSTSSNIRKILVIFQFSITTILIISISFIYLQFKYMKNKDLGFSSENLIYLSLNNNLKKNYEVFKSTLLNNPNIKGVTKTTFLPMNIYGLVNNLSWEGRTNQEKTAFAFQCVEPDFLKTIDYKLIEGRFLSEEFATDSISVVINQKAQKLMNYDNPIGKKIMFGDNEGDGVLNIVGVVKDFHTLPVNEEIEPILLMMYFKDFYTYINVKLDGQNNAETIDYISKMWQEFSPGFPFEYRYMEDRINNMYGDTKKTAKAFTLFVIIAILISSAGLFGLSSFTVEQKTKEIGIRKALGASTGLVYILLNKTFTKWVLISILIGSPIAYYLMKKWLANFAYHINPNIWIFLFSGLLIFLIAQLTVTYQTIKSARSNPVDSLRYE